MNASAPSQQGYLCFCYTTFPNRCSRAEHVDLGVNIQKGCKTFESFLHEINQSDVSSDCACPPSPGSSPCHCDKPALLALLQDGAPQGGFDLHPASVPSCCSLPLLPDMSSIIIYSAVKKCGIMGTVGTDLLVSAVQAHLTHLNEAGQGKINLSIILHRKWCFNWHSYIAKGSACFLLLNLPDFTMCFNRAEYTFCVLESKMSF